MRAAFFNPDRAVEYLLNVGGVSAVSMHVIVILIQSRAFLKMSSKSNSRVGGGGELDHVQAEPGPQSRQCQPQATRPPL